MDHGFHDLRWQRGPALISTPELRVHLSKIFKIGAILNFEISVLNDIAGAI
jgi:hypothetical protein